MRFDIPFSSRAVLASRTHLVAASWIAGFVCLAADPDGDQRDMSWRDERTHEFSMTSSRPDMMSDERDNWWKMKGRREGQRGVSWDRHVSGILGPCVNYEARAGDGGIELDLSYCDEKKLGNVLVRQTPEFHFHLYEGS